jgi:hypothetical protein
MNPWPKWGLKTARSTNWANRAYVNETRDVSVQKPTNLTTFSMSRIFKRKFRPDLFRIASWVAVEKWSSAIQLTRSRWTIDSVEPKTRYEHYKCCLPLQQAVEQHAHLKGGTQVWTEDPSIYSRKHYTELYSHIIAIHCITFRNR